MTNYLYITLLSGHEGIISTQSTVYIYSTGRITRALININEFVIVVTSRLVQTCSTKKSKKCHPNGMYFDMLLSFSTDLVSRQEFFCKK